MKYKLLNQKNPSYDEQRLLRQELLYEGGDCVVDNAHLFISKEEHETVEAYHSRLRCSVYKNYLNEIVNSYVADLFSKPFVVTSSAVQEGKETLLPDFYKEFANDADLRDGTLESVLRKLTAEAMVHKSGYLGVDFPASDYLPQTLLEEEQNGTDRAYVFHIPNRSVIDWECDEFGEYKWVVLRSEDVTRTSLEDSRTDKTVRFKVWEKNDQRVTWKVYETKCKIGKEPRPDAECTMVAEGEVSFKTIPIVKLCLPDELYIGGLVCQPVVSIFRRQSALIHAQNRSLMSLLVYKQGAELPADGSLSEVAQNSQRGNIASKTARNRGALVIGPDDEVSFVEPVGNAFNLVDKQLKDEVEEIHRITHTMANGVAAMSTAVGRSGASKMQDNKAKEIVLTAFADVVKGFIRKLYVLISDARNEGIDWTVLGMDSYRIIDREQTVKEIAAFSSWTIPSKTLRKHTLNRLASELEDDLPPDTLQIIKKEIDEAVDRSEEISLDADTEEALAEKKVETKAKGKKPSKGILVSR